MSLINKIKGILFDEEEIEVPVIKNEEPKEIKQEIKKPLKEENPIKEIKVPKDDFTDKEAYKSESTFTFPIDDFDDDFDTFKEDFKEDKKEYKLPVYENKKVNKHDNYETRDFSDFINRKEEKRKFRPTPIISPVYGILDQNYKKEDVIVKKEVLRKDNEKKLEMIRKKAFGSLEDEIEENLDKKKEIKEEPINLSKTIEELSIEEEPSLETSKNDLKIENTKKEEIPTNTIEDLIEENKDIEKVTTEEINDEEEDLFSLIDSMYEDKGDE